eukprot:Awhi_evm1s3659
MTDMRIYFRRGDAEKVRMVNSTISMEELKELAISTTDFETDIEDIRCIRSEDILKVVKTYSTICACTRQNGTQ